VLFTFCNVSQSLCIQDSFELMKKVPGRWVEPLTPVQKGLLWKTCKPQQVQSWLLVGVFLTHMTLYVANKNSEHYDISTYVVVCHVEHLLLVMLLTVCFHQ